MKPFHRVSLLVTHRRRSRIAILIQSLTALGLYCNSANRTAHDGIAPVHDN
jgi:hypothetical protein